MGTLYVNNKFTKALGERAVKSLKSRGVTIRIVDKLSEFDIYYQILSIPLIFQIGICDENKKYASKNIEMQNNVAKRVQIQENEEKIIDNLVELEFNEFCEILSDIKDEIIAKHLFDIAIYAHLQSNNKNEHKIINLSRALKIDFNSINIEKYKKDLL